MNSILIIFSADLKNTSEKIKNYDGIKRRYCDIITNEDFNKEPNILKEYKVVIDGTTGNRLYSTFLERKNAKQFKSTFDFLKTPTGLLLLKGPSILEMMAGDYSLNENEKSKLQNDIEKYNETIAFAISQIPMLQNRENFQQGLRSGGVIINDILVNASGEVIYKVVRAIPDIKEPNVKYITIEGIEILETLAKLQDKILQE